MKKKTLLGTNLINSPISLEGEVVISCSMLALRFLVTTIVQFTQGLKTLIECTSSRIRSWILSRFYDDHKVSCLISN
jgi:hypothetical protein